MADCTQHITATHGLWILSEYYIHFKLNADNYTGGAWQENIPIEDTGYIPWSSIYLAISWGQWPSEIPM